MIALLALLIDRMPDAALASDARTNIVMYAAIEAISALVASLLLMSHLYDQRVATKLPERAIGVLGVGNFVMWVAVAALSFIAIAGRYTRLEVPIPERYVTQVTQRATDPVTATVTIYGVTYDDVEARMIAHPGDAGAVYVTGWFKDTMSGADVETTVDGWGHTRSLDDDLVVAL